MNEKFNENEIRLLPFSEKSKQIKEKILKLYSNVPKSRTKEAMSDIAEKARYLRNKYPDSDRYEILHAVAASSLSNAQGEGYFIQEDFPGEDSLEQFVDELLKKYSI